MNNRCSSIVIHLVVWLLFAAIPASAQVQLITQRQIMLLEKARRPNDPWPRGDGHVVIGEPGGPLSQKGYHEPGGSFTPSPGSFGISIWVRNNSNLLVATSDSIPAEQVHEQYVFDNVAKIPALKDVTPYYSAIWSYVAAGHWRLELENANATKKLEIVFRSVGPAGGPLESAIWDKNQLLLNRRWIAALDSQPVSVSTGDESKGELQAVALGSGPVVSDGGWAFARIGLDRPAVTLELTDTKPQFASMLSYAETVPQFSFKLPDKRFEESLKAQVATLMMGYIGRQTGPGEPINYPLAWERDGAYSLMAMAKCGQLETARELSVYFAENDFFGGFGAEGDAPGSETNALVELAFLFNDPDYFRWLWPHVVRKMTLIDEMMNAKENIYKDYVGPLVPYLLADPRRHQQICAPSEDGLIVGSMDLHFPILYINAISYRGLIQASRLAERLGHTVEASDWKAKAERLRGVWKSAYGQPKYNDERNFMVSVWPSWIVDKSFRPFVESIEERWAHEWEDGRPKERPLWTYFNVSQAHQWLFLERPERVWEILEYFFAHQCAPGLYTYWEGNGEENTFRQWDNYRGWVKPPYVTPHYWTASEMLHLQLDMLVYVDESKPDFEIVVGGGVPAEWLKREISVKNFRTKAGTVSWEYRDKQLKVTVTGANHQYPVRAGTGFLENGTAVTVAYE